MFYRSKTGLIVSTLLILLTSILVGFSSKTADADPTAHFSLMYDSGRAGMATYLNQGDACPAIDSNSYSVQASFTDAANVVSYSYVSSVSVNGTWNTDPAVGSMVQIPVTAAQGEGTIRAWCVRDGQTVHEMDYTPQLYTVSGLAASATKSKASYLVGDTLHIKAITPCANSVMDAVSYGISGSKIGGNNSLTEPMSLSWTDSMHSTGMWFSDLSIPKKVYDYTTDSEVSPAGNYYLIVSCDVQGRWMTYSTLFFSITELSYVAMGDSYSSGEGNSPFENGTANPGTDECHRSSKAYPRLLADDADLPLSLGTDHFVACSGAKAENITSVNWNGEGPQYNKITSDTALVTMTIGGNDMPFDIFARSCAQVLRGTCNGRPYSKAIAGISNDVIPHVRDMLGALKAKLTAINSSAPVLVIGYPQLVPAKWIYGATHCGWLQPGETPKIRSVITTLNTAIKNEVDAMGGNFHFVSATERDSPFIGHELCRNPTDAAPTYFNNVVVGEPDVYTFHPNKEGQQAYANLIKEYLRTHSLI